MATAFLVERDLNVSGCHRLKGRRLGTAAWKANGNRRLTFRFEKGDAFDVQFEDCHWIGARGSSGIGVLDGKMLKRNRRPTIPGVILRGEFMAGRGLTVSAFARKLEISRKHLSAIVNGKARPMPEVAARLAHSLGTSTALWANLQAAADSWDAGQEYRRRRSAA